MTKLATGNRTALIKLMTTEEEKKVIKERAKELGYKNVSEFIRACINLKM